MEISVQHWFRSKVQRHCKSCGTLIPKELMWKTHVLKFAGQVCWKPEVVRDAAAALWPVQGWLGGCLPHGTDQPGYPLSWLLFVKAIITIVIFIIVIIMLMRICAGCPSSWRLDVPGGYEPPLPRLLPKLSSSVHHLHLSTSINIYHRVHWVHLTKASYLHHNNHPQPRQMKMFNYLSLQSPARSLASTWLLWTFSEVESMESPPTTGQKNILFIKVARGYQNWHRRTYLLSMKIIFHHHIQSTFKHMECFGKSIRQ